MSQLIGNLQTAAPISTTDQLVVEQATGTKKVSILTLIGTFSSNAWALITAGANNVVPLFAAQASSAIGAGGYVNIDVSIVPKGTGAINAAIPDNLILGGNKRGVYAIDWQMQRTLASQVASASYSVISGGIGNLNASAAGVVAGGNGNTNSPGSSYAVIGGGSNNIAGGFTAPTIGGGLQGTVSANYASILGGRTNLIDGDYSAALGGWGGSARAAQSVMVYGGGVRSVTGDSQLRTGCYGVQTANATPVNMHVNGFANSSDNLGNQMNVPVTGVYLFVIELLVKNPAGTSAAFFELRGLLRIAATLATASLVGSPSGTTALFQDAALSGIAVAIAANTTFGGINIQVTGLAATTLTWLARMRTVELVG